MKCYVPMSVPRPGGMGNADRIDVPCGRCYYCMSNKKAEWAFRLREEINISSGADFVTLTYDDDNIPFAGSKPSLYKPDVQNYLKRLRKAQDGSKKSLIRYYMIGEYGPKTLRPHYHGILFNLKPSIKQQLGEIWGAGHVRCGEVTEARVGYISGYFLNKQFHDPDTEKPFSLMSRKPGIGASYIERYREYHERTGTPYVSKNGFKQAMPRYYRGNLFTKEEAARIGEESRQSAEEVQQREKSRIEASGQDYYLYKRQQIDNRIRIIKSKLKNKEL